MIFRDRRRIPLRPLTLLVIRWRMTEDPIEPFLRNRLRHHEPGGLIGFLIGELNDQRIDFEFQNTYSLYVIRCSSAT